jgi:hypothetical protein
MKEGKTDERTEGRKGKAEGKRKEGEGQARKGKEGEERR